MRSIYLDYAATTPVDPRVFAAMQPYFSERFGNPGSSHGFGQRAFRAVSAARQSVAAAFGCAPEGVIFTASATEANNLAIRGVVAGPRSASQSTTSLGSGGPTRLALAPTARLWRDQARRGCESLLESLRGPSIILPHIVTTAIEHDSVREVCRALEREGLAEVTYVGVSEEGIVDPEDVKNALRPTTILVSVMFANNEIGTIQPIFEISKIIQDFKNQNSRTTITSRIQTTRHAIPDTVYPVFHVDAVQAAQFLDCDMTRLGVDLMTVSSHKIYGPKGIGALIGRYGGKRAPLSSILYPLLFGGGQEQGIRSGTENVPAIVGFGKAVELAITARKRESTRLTALRDYFIDRLQALGGVLNGSSIQRLPNNINVSFPGISAEALMTLLDQHGIAASAGSACAAHAAKPSHVLEALGLPEARRKSAVRFSLGRHTRKQDLDYTVRVIAKSLRNRI